MQLLNEMYLKLGQFHGFFMGATFALNIVAAVIFLRSFRRTADRLFLAFSAAFAIMGLNRIAFLISASSNEAQPAMYLVRLLAFCLILWAIVDKNRHANTPHIKN